MSAARITAFGGWGAADEPYEERLRLLARSERRSRIIAVLVGFALGIAFMILMWTAVGSPYSRITIQNLSDWEISEVRIIDPGGRIQLIEDIPKGRSRSTRYDSAGQEHLDAEVLLANGDRLKYSCDYITPSCPVRLRVRNDSVSESYEYD